MANDYIPSHLQSKPVDTHGEVLNDLNNLKRSRTSFNSKTYKVDNLSYPVDLLSSSTDDKYPKTGNTNYGSNYVVFYINVNDSSKLIANQDQFGNQVVGDVTSADKTRLAGQSVSKAQAVTGSAVIGAGAGGVAGAAVKGDIKGAVGGAALAGGVSYVGASIIGTQTAQFSRQLKRLSAAIALHTPNTLSARYNVNYDDESTSAFQLAMKGGEDIYRAVEGGLKNGNIANDVKSSAAAIAATVALNNIPGKEAISNITGLASNPKKEQIFKSVNFREWSFDYQFFPRSKQEYQNVQNIIYLLKLHMHPEYKDANNFLYVYPSEFDIVHYNGTSENLNLPRHTSCVLTDLTINYSPQAQFTSFEGGAPTQINIQMTFKELSQMSKERIMEGF